MKFLFAGCSVFLIISCNTQTKEVKPVKVEVKTIPLNCYSYTNAKDTVLLKTIQVGNSITGSLVYKLDGKDKNMGTIQGYMIGALLVADYTFMSEGLTSVRQVGFKKNADIFLEGYGEVEDNNGKIKFKHIDSLDYSNSFLLQGIDCVN